MLAVTAACLFVVCLLILAMFHAGFIAVARVLGAMLLAVVFFAAAGIHGPAMLRAMLFGAIMRMMGMMAAFSPRAVGVMRAMRIVLARVGTMFGAHGVLALVMIGAVGFTVVLADGFLLAMFDTGFTFFTLGFFAVLHAVMFDGVHGGLMVGAMFRLHGFGRCWRRRHSRCRDRWAARGNLGGFCGSGACHFFGAGATG